MTINGVESHGGYIVTCNIHMIFMSDSAVGFYNLTSPIYLWEIPRFFTLSDQWKSGFWCFSMFCNFLNLKKWVGAKHRRVRPPACPKAESLAYPKILI